MVTLRCEYCGRALGTGDKTCPDCGAPNPHYRPESGKPAVARRGKPKTIDELKAFCAEKGMPLERMRFFIGEDYRQPKAFGIYRDGSDYVVYKNKADGSRSIRYRGPDEAFAVSELYDKLKSEHDRRYGKKAQTRSSSSGSRGGSGVLRDLGRILLPRFMILLIILVLALTFSRVGHRKDGYYRVGEELYYRYGTSWFMDTAEDIWYQVSGFPYSEYRDYYVGKQYDDSWGYSSFTDSEIWDDIQSSDSDWDYDTDYGDWDFGDTDWDSDW